jgi:hypothetical protein
MTSQNSSWDLGRFLKTLAYYGAVPVLSSFDWFQQWFGSHPDPTVDGRQVVGLPAEGATGETGQGETGQVVWVTGNSDLVRAVAEQLTAAGYSTCLTLEPGQPLSQLRAIVCCGPVGPDQAQLEQLRAEGFGVVRRPIFDFSQTSQTNFAEIWGALDDVVMGGVSQSGIRFQNQVASFEGYVSTANSGGFASVRTRNLEPALDLSAYAGVELRLRGDGQRYKFMLRTETRWDGVAYCFSFDTAAELPPGAWQTVRIPFTALIPVFRARTVADSPLNTRQVTAWQLMLSKFEYDGGLNPHFKPGWFQLRIASIQVYRPADKPKLIWIAPSLEAEQWLKTTGLPHRRLEPDADSTRLANAVVAVLG